MPKYPKVDRNKQFDKLVKAFSDMSRNENMAIDCSAKLLECVLVDMFQDQKYKKDDLIETLHIITKNIEDRINNEVYIKRKYVERDPTTTGAYPTNMREMYPWWEFEQKIK